MPGFKPINNAERLRPRKIPEPSLEPVYQRPGFINRVLSPIKEMLATDDFERLYLRNKPKNDIFFRSPYLPTVRTKDHNNFVSVNDSLFLGSVLDHAEMIRAFESNPDSIRKQLLNDYHFKRGTGFLNQEADAELLSDFAPPKQTESGNWQIARRVPTQHLKQNPLGSYTIGFGKDERGNYVSYADEFGVTPQNNRFIFRVAEKLGITKPFDVYGRIYEDENPRVAPLFKQQKTQ